MNTVQWMVARHRPLMTELLQPFDSCIKENHNSVIEHWYDTVYNTVS